MADIDDILAGLDTPLISKHLADLAALPTLKALDSFQSSATFKALDAIKRSSVLDAFRDHPASVAARAAKLVGRPSAIAHASQLAELSSMNAIGRALAADVSAFRPAAIKLQADMERAWSRATFAPPLSATIASRYQETHDRLAGSALPWTTIGELATLPALTRANQWASSLLSVRSPARDLAYLGTAEGDAVAEMMKAARTISEMVGGETLTGSLGLATGIDAHFGATAVKLSALVGAREIHGVDAGISDAAYRGLFGEWHTRPNLSQRFWRDPAYRRAAYRDAQVDEGLIEANVGAALDIMIDGGLTGGFREEGRSTALLTFGGMTLSIGSTNLRSDAHKVLGEFEETMRAFISAKLQAKAGSKWFTQRVDGVVVSKAKGARDAAVRRDEAPLPLINYTDLGELSGIVTRNHNWSEVFEEVFINKADFDHDMQRLVALRRPTAHNRKVDALRLMEAMCVMDRLDRRMKLDGGWRAALESDE